MQKQKILDRINFADFYKTFIPSLKVNGKAEAMGLCPFHEDENPSLSVNIRTGLYHCHSCKDGGDVVKFLMRLKQITFKEALNELSSNSDNGRDTTKQIEAVYPYTDEGGILLFEVVRFVPKTFRQRRPDGRGGRIWNLDGVRIVPYRLPEVKASDTVFICEGEKDCNNLANIGLAATTNPQGAGKWRGEFSQYFTGKDIVIICDNDEPGAKHGQDVAQKLVTSARSIKVIEQLPGVPTKGDVSDWLKIPGNDTEKLLKLVRDTPLWSPQADKKDDESGFDLTKALKIGAELQELDLPVSWAVKGLLPQEAITLLSARGGMGKTILSISIADAVSRGIPFLGLETAEMPVVYIDFENSLPTLCERVKRIDAKHVLFWHGSNEIKPPRLDKEYELYKKLPQKALLIFDTLRASQSRDENDSQHMAMIMQRLKELRDCGYTILLLHHTSKGNDKIYKGSTAIFDLCDHNLSLHKAKKGCHTPEENETDDDDDNCCYRFGTQDKTRYEPFSMFLEFDTEKGCFALAPDPETETLEEIHSLLAGKNPLKTNDIFELVRDELRIKYKGKVIKLLKKGEGKYWISESQGKGKPTYYRVAKPNQSGGLPYIYPDHQTTHKVTGLPIPDHLPQERLDSPDFTDWSGGLNKSQTSQTTSKVTGLAHIDQSAESQTSQTSQKPTLDIPFEVENVEVE
ncbi:MAG: hypothetical protein AYP45_08705 [Candidatus Brocadia carolinensis]|uniref:Zinc finger CHC2-type domain-containing protein n=1 Tax=Candidatus Brocadia carolinensis TaxID=1004156 RepID=A0A1V4ATP8_9BACT|nr:MAG: hypothetical protein AYP45_08705 [Candidatus Brocadia caroliniensis]